MYRIDNHTALPTLAPPTPTGVAPNSYFTDATGAPTAVDAEWLNMTQEEIANVITDEGLLDPILDKHARNQLLMGIRREVNASGGGGNTQPALTYITTGVHYDVAVPLPQLVVTTICSIQVPAGNWMVWGHLGINTTTGVLYITKLAGGVGIGQNATMPFADSGLSGEINLAAGHNDAPLFEFSVGCKLVTLPATTTIYLLGESDYQIAPPPAGFGFLAARAV